MRSGGKFGSFFSLISIPPNVCSRRRPAWSYMSRATFVGALDYNTLRLQELNIAAYSSWGDGNWAGKAAFICLGVSDNIVASFVEALQ